MSKEIFFEVDGGTVTALDHGGTGYPVLLVHGSGHNAAAWEAVVAGLLPRHRVIAVDLRGHGHSTAESRTAEQYWRDLAVVVTPRVGKARCWSATPPAATPSPR
ncbi:alpha/beta fold hydrolase [Micromonospora nigra]|uniref:alpha/beta fold hydrolase n=1 Tax=Micromonospora nigra TaxID=145857 RepID=UPI000AD1BCAD|nr:alpha/beta fold hydrolase [Micromonospora nigra]